MELEYKGVRLVVKRGDITQEDTDAIVNPANSLMLMGGGVALAIKNAGGEEIEREARRKAPVPVGEAIATGAGRLKARYVIHAPTMDRPAKRITSREVRLAVRAALDLARRMRLRSVAIPGMGTGVGGVPKSLAARVMVDEILSHINEGTSLEEIRLVAFSDDLEREFREALDEYVVRKIYKPRVEEV